RYADQPAFVNMGEVMTFRKLEERSRAFAAYLQQGLGLKKGDRSVAASVPAQPGVTIGGLTIPAPPTDAQITGGGRVDAVYILATP
ncbi:hypothetical protein ONK29_25675, partial [Salmonella enterica subsp. enterica serovar Anatum]|nr:hypothetical protein [Salmonella enterica subsp. enterica serovar Anatum]